MEPVEIILESYVMVPIQGTPGSAGYDLASKIGLLLLEDERITIHTGVRCKIPEGYVGLLFLRSSMAGAMILENSVGVIDSDYRGEICLKIKNVSGDVLRICRGDRIAQLVFIKVEHPSIIIKDVGYKFDDTERNIDGFGSTGK